MMWLYITLYALGTIQGWRIMLGIFYNDGMINDGEDVFFGCTLAIVLALSVWWIIVPMRFVYVVYNKYEWGFNSLSPKGLERLVVPVKVETRAEKSERKRREAETTVKELRAQLAERS